LREADDEAAIHTDLPARMPLVFGCSDWFPGGRLGLSGRRFGVEPTVAERE